MNSYRKGLEKTPNNHLTTYSLLGSKMRWAWAKGPIAVNWHGVVRPQMPKAALDPEEVAAASLFLARCNPTKTVGVHSYHLKHVIERAMRRYISNGATIRAAQDLGLPLAIPEDPTSPNAIIGVSKRSVRDAAGALRIEV
jgi:hypothetical protein